MRQRRTIRGAGGRAYETERCPSQLWGSWRPSESRRADDPPVTAAFRGNTATTSARALNCSEAHWRTLAHNLDDDGKPILVKAGATELMTTQRATHNPQQLSIDAPAPAVLPPARRNVTGKLEAMYRPADRLNPVIPPPLAPPPNPLHHNPIPSNPPIQPLLPQAHHSDAVQVDGAEQPGVVIRNGWRV